MVRTRMIAGVALCVGVALAGCGGGGGGADVASLSGDTSTTVKAKSSSSVKDQRDALLAYTKCLRKEGIHVDDPTFGNDGPSGNGTAHQLGDGTTDGPSAVIATPGGSISLPSPDDPAFKAADVKCKPILDAAQADMPKPSPEQQAEAQDRALAFAKCMRKHGVDMPDPTFDSKGGISIMLPSGAAPDSSSGPSTGKGPSKAVQAASKACEKTNPMGKGGPGFGMTSSGGKR
jgi:hypothetical protein